MYACSARDTLDSSPRLPSLGGGRVSVVLVLSLSVAFCSDGATTPSHRVVTLSIRTGDAQAAEVGTEVTAPLVVVAADTSGLPLRGIEVRFDGVGQAVRIQSRTDAEGRAWAYWQLGPQAGAQTMRATAVAPNVPKVTFRATGIVGPPASITRAGAELIATPGTQLDTLVVSVTDQFFNVIEAAAVNWSVLQGGGSVKPVGGFTDAQGRARAVWTLGPAVGLQRIVVSAGSASRQFSATATPVFFATQVVAGSDHSCALTSTGAAFCWGSNWIGQLGRGHTDRQSNPYPVEIPGYRFQSLATGGSHSCGLTSDGAAYCWGDNRAGQVGVAGTDLLASPTRVADAPPFVALTAGWFHTCGVTNGGQMYCWGDNSLGQLGRGTDRSVAAPLQYFSHHKPELVAGSLRFTSISSSPSATSTCGVADGGVYCWGESLEGVLGAEVQQLCRLVAPDELTGEPVEWEVRCNSSPVRVSIPAATSVMLERYSACAILTTTELECWGSRSPPALVPEVRVTNAWTLWGVVCGEAATGEVTCRRILPPHSVDNPFGTVGALVNLHSSGRHHCGIAKATSVVYCWGTNYDGALGDGTTLHRDFPVPVVSPLAARSP